MDIIIKRGGPRPEDIEAKRHIQKNWGTIEKLADQISGGSYSSRKIKKPSPEMSGFIICDLGSRRAVVTDPEPSLRISMNGRVIVMDLASGRQLHFLGQIKWRVGVGTFYLATKENGYFSKINDALFKKISDLDQKLIDDNFTEDELTQELNKRLELG